jgi:hypothetical protein
MILLNIIRRFLSGSYDAKLENLQKVLAERRLLDIVLGIKDCSGGNNSPSQHSLRRAVSFFGFAGIWMG